MRGARAVFAWIIACVACAVALLCGTGAVRADDAADLIAPIKPPAGYEASERAGVRWIAPRGARSTTQELQRFEPGAWHKVVSELGASALSQRLDIRIARNRQEMEQLAPRGVPLPGYANGIAFPDRGLILLTLSEPGTWIRPNMRSVLTHELSHVALYRAVAGNNVPRWFSEGVAVHQASENSLGRIRTLWDGSLRGNLLPLSQLSNAFPESHAGADLAYAQSADFVSYLLSHRGDRARFHALLAQLAAQQPFDEAVETAYRVPLEYLERQWREALNQRYGRWPAIMMGLTFVWIVGAILLVIGFVRTRMRHRETLQRWAIEEAPMVPTPPPAPASSMPAPMQSNVDAFFDKRVTRSESGVPTVVHDGQSHTLH